MGHLVTRTGAYCTIMPMTQPITNALWAIGCAALFATQRAGAQDAARVRAAVQAYRQAHDVEIVRELADLLAIPNLASDSVNIRRNARHIVQMLERRGIAARLLE